MAGLARRSGVAACLVVAVLTACSERVNGPARDGREPGARSTPAATASGASAALDDPTAGPSAAGSGFIAGSGFLTSPIGALTSDPTRTGRADFRVVAKHVPGRTAPVGQMEYRFPGGGFVFESSGYQSLVVDESTGIVELRGTGRWNGYDGFLFTIRAQEGDPDSFQIVIREPGGLPYYGTFPNGGVGTPLDGGNITIHLPKH